MNILVLFSIIPEEDNKVTFRYTPAAFNIYAEFEALSCGAGLPGNPAIDAVPLRRPIALNAGFHCSGTATVHHSLAVGEAR